MNIRYSICATIERYCSFLFLCSNMDVIEPLFLFYRNQILGLYTINGD